MGQIIILLYLKTSEIFMVFLQRILKREYNLNRIYFLAGQVALGFQKHYVSVMGDHSPESGRVLLPLGSSIMESFRKYCNTHSPHDQVSQSLFYEVWKENMAHVSFQSVSRLQLHFTNKCK